MIVKHRRRLLSLLLSIVLASTSITPVLADKKENALENELSTLNKELKNMSNELDGVINKIDKSTKQIKKLKQELAVAEGKKEAQYESMKARIKYMYESGNTSFLEILLSSGSMADFIGKCEIISAVTTYEQESIQKLTDIQKEIATKQAKLEKDQKQLVTLKKELSEKEDSLKEKISSTSTELTTYKKQLEDAKKKEQDAQNALDAEVNPIKPSRPTYPTTPDDPNNFITASASDIELFAALIECEAGSTHYEGMLAVASVVVNRMKHHKYPDTLRGVIFQSGQFPPATNGLVDQKLARGVKASCVQVAKDALAGKNNVGNCLSFRSASSNRPGTVIGSNVFF